MDLIKIFKLQVRDSGSDRNVAHAFWLIEKLFGVEGALAAIQYLARYERKDLAIVLATNWVDQRIH